MQTAKKVSVITPFHNVVPEVFKKTAQSLLAVGQDDWEWIVVLHNTDNITAGELRTLVGNDRLLTVYEKRDDRHTPSAPRNLGLSKAQGEFIYFLDGDDLIEPDFIPKALARMEHDNADIGIGRVKVVHKDKGVMHVPLPLLFPFKEGGYTVQKTPDELGRLLYGAPMMLGSKLIRRSLISENGTLFDEEIALTEDVIFMLLCCAQARKISVYKDLVAYRYMQSEGSLLQNMILKNDSSEEIYLKPLRKIVSLAVENGFSPSDYLWNMFGLFSSIYANDSIDKGKRDRLMAGIQEYLPNLGKQPPEGIGPKAKEQELAMQYEEILNIAFSRCENETFRKYFLRHVFTEPDKTGVEWRDMQSGKMLTMSYGTLARKAAALGAVLYKEGLIGKTVAIAGEKSIAWVIACIACFTFGAAVVPIDQTYGAQEVARRVSFSEAKAVLTDNKHRLGDACPDDVMEISLDDMEQILALGESMVKQGEAFDGFDFQCNEKDRSLMIFTSGTGGKTKCAVLDQKNLTPERYLWTGIEMDRYPCLSMLPYCHVAGIKDIIGALITGTYINIGSGTRYLIDDFLHVRPVCVTMVPLQAKFFAKMLEGRTAAQAREILGDRIKVLRLVGAPVTESLRSLYSQWNIDIHSNYGLSETCGTVSCSYMKDGKIYSKPGSIGRVIEGVEVRIDQPDETGNGEIMLKGQIVFEGYLNDAEETSAAFKDGWLKTGDIGHIDEDRCLFIQGRKKNIIILPNGENVIPEEIEREIQELPHVKECIVYEENSILCARIVLEQGDDYAERCAAVDAELQTLKKKLHAAMRPEKTELTDIPLERTVSGKIKRQIHGS